MTKQEIEKAIKNGENVWCICWNNIYEIKATNIQKINKGEIEYFDKTKDFYLEVNLLDIYKTKAEAEHYLHHANITRTEQLPFLTWEEFKEIGQISFTGKDKKEYILKKDITWSNNKYTLVDCLKIVNETDFTFSKYFDYTEENFYKAYDECVRLFKGDV